MKSQDINTNGMSKQLEITVLTASDLSPKYLDCVPWYIDFWLSQESQIPGVSFRPAVLVIADELPELLKNYSEYCTLINTELPTAFVSQNIRTLYSALVDSDLVMTSDVDMLTMNSKLIDAALGKWADSKIPTFAILRDVLPAGQFAICYSVAAPLTWSNVFQIRSIEDVHIRLNELFEKLNSDEYLGSHGGYGWFIDQEYLFEQVSNSEQNGNLNLLRFKDNETGHRRLDRVFHRGPLKWIVIPMIIQNRYSDYHVHHPVGKYSKYLSALLKIKQKKKSF